MRRVLLLLSLPLLCSAASITYNASVSFTTTSPTLGASIRGFDTSLGQFESATVKLVLDGSGSFGYFCPDAPDGVTCGDWEQDPETQEWVLVAPRRYTGPLPWRLLVSSDLYDWDFTRYWGLGGGFDFSAVCGFSECYLDETVVIEQTTTDPVFTLAEYLYWDLRTNLSMDARTFFAEGYAPMSEASYFGGAVLEITYNYNAVPEPSVAPMCAAALLALALRRMMVSRRKAHSGLDR
jgi:hypothetical protein